jgi:hypothetical protein
MGKDKSPSKDNSPGKDNISGNGRYMRALENMSSYVHAKITALNQSKIFAGIMIVIINIASKFVNFKVSKTVESYLKFTFSRHVLVFAATWMGTRDIYIAAVMTLLFIIVVDFLFNEESMFCCLPETFVNKQVSKLEGLENLKPTQEEIVKAKIILEKHENNKNKDENGDDKMARLVDSNLVPLYDVNTNISGY